MTQGDGHTAGRIVPLTERMNNRAVTLRLMATGSHLNDDDELAYKDTARLLDEAVAAITDLRSAATSMPAFEAMKGALRDTEAAISTLPEHAFGYASTDNGLWPIRDELLSNIRAALAASGGAS